MLFRTVPGVVTPSTLRAGCEACSLSAQWPRLQHPRIEPEGSETPLVYFVGEAPGGEEDEQGRPFVGKTGRMLRNALFNWDRAGIPYRIGNVARCKPPGNETPKPSEIAACWNAYGLADVVRTRPKVIVPIGGVALNRFLPGRISEWERVRVPYSLDGAPTWVYPLYHPSFLLRTEEHDESKAADLQKLWRMALDDMALTVLDWETPTIVSHEEALTGIRVILPNDLTGCPIEGRTLGIDIETTTLMPWERGAKILSASVSNGTDTVAWLCEHPENPYPERALAILLETLRRGARFVAHHAGFEIRWLTKYFGLEVLGWSWCDSMARPFATHGVIQGEGGRNEEEGSGRLAGLGKQTQVNFGFDVKAVLNVDPVKWQQYPVETLLLYNGLDAKWCRKVWHCPLPDWARVEVDRQRGAVRAMSAIAWRGMLVDQNELARQATQLEASIKIDTHAITMSAEVIQWEAAGHKKFNPGSPDQVAQFFELESSDEDALRDVDSPLAVKILRLRKLEKLHATYAKGIYKALYDDGYLHPDYSTMRVVTGRTSTQKPNAQNMPVRENKEFRKVIVPPPGCALVSFDYRQLEARGVAMSSKDRVLLGFIWDDHDIHREWAIEVLDNYPEIADRLCPHTTDDKKVLGRVRGEMKNGFTFPLIYGAGLERCARELVVPEDILGPIVERFWVKYAGIRAWQQVMHNFYYKHWYVETMTLRRRFAPVSWAEQLNSPIQGTGSDLVVDAAVRLTDLAVEQQDPHLIPMVNVHDDLAFYLPTQRMQRYIETIAKVMVTPTYAWITIPLEVEVKVGTHNWSDQSEFRTYKTTDFFPISAGDLEHKIAGIQALALQHQHRGVIVARPATPARTPLNAARRERIALTRQRP